jgi:pimeloyl-ACP methyl ester carboxylesterase
MVGANNRSIWTLIFSLAFTPATLRAEPPKLPVPAVDQSALGQRGYFFVGGRYVGEPGKEIMQGQAYVEVLAPKDVRRPYPLVLIHGAGTTGTYWMGTPDGRKGWAYYFVGQGYVVYVIDQPMHGRSASHPSDGPTVMLTRTFNENQLTAFEHDGKWPQAKLHTQFPGDGPNKGRKGDPIFDELYAGMVESNASAVETEQRNKDAGAALLDRIGPAILLTHSQAGYFGWSIADTRPNLVKAILAIEPAGPPFENPGTGIGQARAYGLTHIPIAYDPPIKDAIELAIEREDKADAPDLSACWTQKSPARQLVNLKNIPVMIITAEASFHAVYDHCTAKYLNQAGVKTDFIRLRDLGIRGNGHAMMIEKNNLEIARVLDEWVLKNVR